MLTREEYKKTYIRMMDSNRIYCKGSHSCDGVSCGKCPLHSLCEETESDSFHSFEIIEAVEQWGKNIRLLQIEKSGKKFSDQQKFLCASKLIEKTHAMNMDVAA